MSLFERMERKLERTVNGVFARAFRSEVQPLELASAVRRAMDDRATMLGRGRTVVPNLFTVELSSTDYERLTEFDEELEAELVAAAQEHAESQRYQPGGPVQVLFDEDDTLETGVFRVRPATSRRRVEQAADVEEYSAEYVEAEGEDYDEYTSGSWELSDLPDESTQRDRPGRPAPAAHPAPPAKPDYYEPPPWNPGPTHEEPPTRPQQPVAPPAPPRRVSVEDRPWLEIHGERYPLIGAMTVLGRDETADIVVDDPGISRRHCEVRVTHDGPHLVSHLRDLRSTNGTYVNGDHTEARRLVDGDRITVGRTDVVFRVRQR